jgi:thiol-disulfide isomerase/thioredoxin
MKATDMLNRTIAGRVLVPVLAAILLGAGEPATQPTTAPARTAEAILADLKAIVDPVSNRGRGAQDPQARKEADAARATLTLELYKVSPDAPELEKLLPARWNYLKDNGKSAVAIAEISDYLAGHADPKVVAAAANMRVTMEIDSSRNSTSRQLALAEYEKASPGNPKLPDVLRSAYSKSRDEQEKQGYVDRLVKDFPAALSTKLVVGARHAQSLIGKPFELSFKDAITGKDVTMADYKGKVVVIDFWATWCAPCRASLPGLSKFYHANKDKGVDVISVSLDMPNKLPVLQRFVAGHDMPWAHYYQGNYWESDFSDSMGIAAIPAMFVVDTDGNLASTDPQGRLDELVAKLLAERKAAPATQPVAAMVK